ncbi:MAG: leucine-rich repeat domain-containing protein, partial [Ruminococcus sp.]|nr:leucine-rich repeat domain-containing protein [Ruminococcus sp.]
MNRFIKTISAALAVLTVAGSSQTALTAFAAAAEETTSAQTVTEAQETATRVSDEIELSPFFVTDPTDAATEKQTEAVQNTTADKKAVEAVGANSSEVTWSYNENTCVLTISGTGAMADYNISGSNTAPWQLYKNYLKKIVIEDGVTSIGNGAFAYCSKTESVEIADSVTSIGDYAFY